MHSNMLYFYPRSPCGERHTNVVWCIQICYISIHALLAESDFQTSKLCDLLLTFLSTLSLRRATACLLACFVGCFYFYPRSPCGERPWLTIILRYFLIFLSTLSLRRATLAIHTKSREYAKFLSTLSLRRATSGHTFWGQAYQYFYPRSPCGERP